MARRRGWSVAAHFGLGFILTSAAACTPQEQYREPVEELGVATQALSEAISSISGGLATEERRYLLRQRLTDALISIDAEDGLPTFLYDTVFVARDGQAPELLCEVVQHRAALQAKMAFIRAVSVQASALAADPVRDLGKLIPELVAGHQAPELEPGGQGEQIVRAQSDCENDVATYVFALYPSAVLAPPDGRRELAIAAIPGAVLAAKEFYDSVIRPLALGIAHEAVIAQRGERLRELVLETKEDLQKAIDASADIIELSYSRKRFEALKGFLDQSEDFYSRHLSNKSSIESLVAGRVECDEWIAIHSRRNGDGLGDEWDPRAEHEFRSCFDAVWNEWSAGLENLFAAAARYDTELMRQPEAAAENLRTLATKLEEIATGKESLETSKLILATVVRLSSLFGDIQSTATSPETQKKFGKLVEAFNEVLQEE